MYISTAVILFRWHNLLLPTYWSYGIGRVLSELARQRTTAGSLKDSVETWLQCYAVKGMTKINDF